MSLGLVLGMSWGDEGKGRITDAKAETADFVARFCGANNAGHGLEVDGQRYTTTILPSGVLHGKKLLIGPGVATDPTILEQEIKFFEEKGYSVDLVIDPRVPVTLPHHRQRDGANERLRGSDKVGSVGFGAGYSQADRTNRLSVRFGDLLHPNLLEERIRKSYAQAVPILQAIYGEKLMVPIERVVQQYTELGSLLGKYIGNVSEIVTQALIEGKTVLCESSQGACLDLDFGTWPQTTGSNIGAGRVYTGLGIPAYPLETIGVVKAFSSRAGYGPFPTKFEEGNAVGKHLIERGNQYELFPGYSEVSVRPLDVGWLDLVILKTMANIHLLPTDTLALTHLDTLAGLNEVKVATGYRYGSMETDKVDPMQAFPFRPDEVRYTSLSGWPEIKGVTTERDLPDNARRFIELVEKTADRKIRYLSFSPNRGDLIDRSNR